MMGEPCRAAEAFLFTRKDGKQHAAFQIAAVMKARELNERSDVSRIVERSVVEAVAVDRLAEAVAIEVSRDDDVFVLQRGIASGEDSEDVLRRKLLLRHVQ